MDRLHRCSGIINTYAGMQNTVQVTNQLGKANTIPIGSNFGLAIDTNNNIYTSERTFWPLFPRILLISIET
jgi:hypothetical protein